MRDELKESSSATVNTSHIIEDGQKSLERTEKLLAITRTAIQQSREILAPPDRERIHTDPLSTPKDLPPKNDDLQSSKCRDMTGFNHRILVVDDEAAIRMTAEALLSAEGYEVVTAADGFDGLVQLRRSLPDVVISDLSMPNMSGFEFLSVVRKRFPQLPVIAISAVYHGGLGGVIADAFFFKGEYSPEELFTKIRTLIEAGPIRPYVPKSDGAPVWVPVSDTGYFVVTCPACLRSSSVEAENSPTELREVECPYCQRAIRILSNKGVNKPSRAKQS